jgi:hypothetical protein
VGFFHPDGMQNLAGFVPFVRIRSGGTEARREMPGNCRRPGRSGELSGTPQMNLWHGNIPHALKQIDNLEDDLEMLEENPANKKKMLKVVREFRTYIDANQAFIPNCGDRYQHDQIISTSFVESTVNYVISKRFVKKQQMRWTQRGAHLLLQTRV